MKRLYELNQFQQNKKAEIQFQLFQKELQELTWSPEISQYSRKLAAKNIPLHLRLGQCLETKQKNLEKIKFNMEQEKKLKIISKILKY